MHGVQWCVLVSFLGGRVQLGKLVVIGNFYNSFFDVSLFFSIFYLKHSIIYGISNTIQDLFFMHRYFLVGSLLIPEASNTRDGSLKQQITMGYISMCDKFISLPQTHRRSPTTALGSCETRSRNDRRRSGSKLSHGSAAHHRAAVGGSSWLIRGAV